MDGTTQSKRAELADGEEAEAVALHSRSAQIGSAPIELIGCPGAEIMALVAGFTGSLRTQPCRCGHSFFS